jgi:pimeloyl-ACP methyl ester carboxylesterase
MKKYKKILQAGLISSAILFTTWGLNKLIFLQAGMKDLLSTKHKRQYSWRFGDVFYIKEGSGSPVLLIHELKSTASAAEWNVLIDALAKTHTVYALDLIGCGRSEKPKMTYTNYIYVQLINNFIKDVIGSRADVITSGSASSIAIMGCHSEPELYHRIMMVNPMSMKDMARYPKANHKTLKYLIELPLIGTTIYNLIHSRRRIMNHYQNSVLYADSEIEKAADTMYEACHLGGASSRYFYASERSYFTNINMLHALKKLNHSMYIIGGGEAPGIREVLDAYVACNPSIETELIENCKQYPHIEQPEEFLSLCSIYLE